MIAPPYATALSCLKGPAPRPIDQVAARFFNRVGVDLGFENVAVMEAVG
jgi:hypothetical protein